MLANMLKRKIKGLKYDKLIVEKEKGSNFGTGVAYVTSNDYFTLKQLIKLHYHVYASYKLRTYLQGFAYDSMEEIEEPKENVKTQKILLKMSLEQIKKTS